MKSVCVLFLSIIFVPLLAASALEFDGIDDHVQLSSVMNIGNSSNTIEAWIKIPTAGSGNLIEGERVGILLGNYDEAPNVGWEIHSLGQLRMWWNFNDSGYQFYGTTDLRDNAWHHIAFVRDVAADSSFMYVDGVLDTSYGSAGTNITLTTSFYIGADRRGPDTPYFHGTIDELRIWNTARTQAEIREYMCEDVTGSTGLLAYYQMSNDAGTSLTDNTGNGYTGTLINMDNSDWINDNQIPDGDGSSTPYQINGLNQLYWLSQNSGYWSADFNQITDITATATESWDGGAGFTPIGNNSTYFTGTYDGNNYVIDGLNIDRSTQIGIGLFGYVYSGAAISNVHVLNMIIYGDYAIGGVAGVLNSSSISQCSSTGSISCNRYAGGLVGNLNSGTVSESFSSASVSFRPGGSGDGLGGLAAYSAGTIRDCYATGDISGDYRVGGLTGAGFSRSSTINCYATGSVSGSSLTGGFMGYAAPLYEDPFEPWFNEPAAVITACFWDTEASGNAVSAAGTGKTTSEMKTLSTYTDAGWDFAEETVNGTDNYWGINNTQHDGYPFLSWEDYTHDYSDTPLPVTLTSFQAMDDNGVVKLTWSTKSETQNLGYVLERKIGDGDWDLVASYMTDHALIGNGTTTQSHDYLYSDADVIAGQTYKYRLSDVNESNRINVLRTLSITLEGSDVLTPMAFGISKTYPNPFNPELTISYFLTESAETVVRILNLKGQTIAVLDNGFKASGSHELQWRAENTPTGIYFVEVSSNGKCDLSKVLLIK